MAELSIRKGNGGGPAWRSPGLINNPLRAMRDLLRWDPFSELAPLVGRAVPTEGLAPAFDIKETPQAFVFKADLPGFSDKDLDITNAGNQLTIAGSRQEVSEEKDETYYVCERRQGSFTRAFTLPVGADLEHVNAELKHGVLTVTVPRKASGKEKKIAIKSGGVKA